MAITSMSALGTAGLQQISFSKGQIAAVAAAANQFVSIWSTPGNPAAGSLSIGNTTTGAVPTNATTGAFPIVNAGGGQTLYLVRSSAGMGNTSTVFLADRLWHAGSFSFSNGTVNSNASTALTRGDTTGGGSGLWVEIATNMGATPANITVTYTNPAGATNRTATCAVPASMVLGQFFPFQLASGDTGVQQITNVTCDAAPSGSFNLVIARRIHEFSTVAGAYGIPPLYWGSTGMVQIPNNACLFFYQLIVSTATTNTTVNGQFVLAMG